MKENLGHLEQNFGLKMRFLWGFVRGLWLTDTDLNGRFLLRKVAKGQRGKKSKPRQVGMQAKVKVKRLYPAKAG